MPPSRVLALGHQASYRCRHSGACCTAGWSIPVEPERTPVIRASFGDVFEPYRLRLRTTSSGACVLFEPARGRDPSLCAVHRACGHDALPSACRHFPRVYLHDGHATRVTLSHFCPTAASLAFADSQLRIVEAPIELAPPGDREGLDALEALPPLLHPRMLMDVESYAAWESAAIAVLANTSGPAAAIARLAMVTELIRMWQPLHHGPSLQHYVRNVFQQRREAACGVDAEARLACDLDDASTWQRHYELAWETVPRGLTVPDMPTRLKEADAGFVAPRWDAFSPVLLRYLAGRLFGSWVAYQGRGLRTVVASLVCALSVVRIEAVRECLTAGRILDAPLLTAAIRHADLLLVHRADRQELATRLSHVEHACGAGL